MKNKFQSLSVLSRTFVMVSFALVALVAFLYVKNVSEALTMDETSYNCTTDSMMMQICHDPFGSSITWSVVEAAVLGSPLLILWVVLGVIVLVRVVVTRIKSSRYAH